MSNGGAVVSLVTPDTFSCLETERGWFNIGKSPKMAPSFWNLGASEI